MGEPAMSMLSPRRLGFAMGTSLAVFYLLCAAGAAIIPQKAGLQFLNAVAHSIDWNMIVVPEISWTDVLCGAVAWLVLGWLFGALVAVLYNAAARCGKAGLDRPIGKTL